MGWHADGGSARPSILAQASNQTTATERSFARPNGLSRAVRGRGWRLYCLELLQTPSTFDFLVETTQGKLYHRRLWTVCLDGCRARQLRNAHAALADDDAHQQPVASGCLPRYWACMQTLAMADEPTPTQAWAAAPQLGATKWQDRTRTAKTTNRLPLRNA